MFSASKLSHIAAYVVPSRQATMGDQTQIKLDDQQEPIYGGCEGPDVMFVKLISQDGHEFIIKRDYALTSATIKAMLSGPGKQENKSTRT